MKKYIIIAILVFAAVIKGQLSFSQSLSEQKSEALNTYIEYMNFLFRQMKSEANNLLEYHSKAMSFRQSGRRGVNSFYFKKVLAGDDDTQIYKRTLKQGDNYIETHKNWLNSDTKKLHETYVASIKLMHELEVYHKLADYQTDKFKRYDEIVQQMQQLFFDFNKVYWNLYEKLDEVYTTYQTNTNNKYLKCAQQMKTALQKERKLYKNWYYNFEDDYQTGLFKPDLLIENINETDVLYNNLQVPEYLEHPLGFYYNRFFSGLTSTMQSYKSKAIDEYTFEAAIDDKHSNQYFKNLHQYYNSLLVAEYNNYAYALKQKGIYLLNAPRLPLLFVCDTNSITINYPFKTFENKPIIEFEVDKQSKPVSKNIIAALNNYIDYMNRETKIAFTNAKKFRTYNQNLNKYYGTDLTIFQQRKPYPFKLYKDIRIARSLYEKAKNQSRYLQADYAKLLNQQIDELNSICSHRQKIVSEINIYARQKDFLNDNFAQAYRFLEQMEFLWKEYDKRKQQLYNDVKRIYDSYSVRNLKSPWYKSSVALEKIMDENTTLLFHARKHYTDSVNIVLDIGSIDQQVRNCLTEKYENTKGLDRFGRNHGYCPFTIYDDIPLESKDFALKYQELKTTENDTVVVENYRSKLLRFYNDIIDDFNKFVWLAAGDYEEFSYHKTDTFFLLKRPLQTDVFEVSNPFATPETQKTDKDSIFTTMTGYPYCNITLLLDVSGSMAENDKLPVLKEAFLQLLRILRPDDFVSVVVYSGNAKVVLEPTSCLHKETIARAIESLNSDGNTQINKGLKKALAQAESSYIKEGNNIIILATDGAFTTNRKTNKITENIHKNSIGLTVFLFGNKNIARENLQTLIETAKGKIEIITPENMNRKLLNEVKKIKK